MCAIIYSAPLNGAPLYIAHHFCPAPAQVVRPTKEQIAKGVMIPHLFENPKRREDPVIKALLEQASPGRPVTR